MVSLLGRLRAESGALFMRFCILDGTWWRGVGGGKADGGFARRTVGSILCCGCMGSADDGRMAAEVEGWPLTRSTVGNGEGGRGGAVVEGAGLDSMKLLGVEGPAVTSENRG